MTEPVWVNPNLILALQEELVYQHGGKIGIRDPGLLEAALARPQQIFFYSKPDIIELAGAYINGIIRNHPFIDGNKRIAIVAGALFLELNGFILIAPEIEALQAILDLTSKKINEEEFTFWLRENSEKHQGIE